MRCVCECGRPVDCGERECPECKYDDREPIPRERDGGN